MLLAGPLARIHLRRLVARLELLRELREGQAELVRVHTFGLFPKQFVTEQVEFLAKKRIFQLGPAKGGLEVGDQRPRGGEIRDGLRRDRHARP
jgi:hypothetical protein